MLLVVIDPLVPRVQKIKIHQRALTDFYWLIGEGAAPATDPKECLNSLTEVTYRVQSVTVFCHIKIIYLKGDILQSNAFHNIWQQVLPPPLTQFPPHSFVVGRFVLYNLKSKYSEDLFEIIYPWPSHMSIIELICKGNSRF